MFVTIRNATFHLFNARCHVIIITRSMARLVRAVFRKALGLTARDRLTAVLVESGAEGLLFKARTHNLAAEYHVPGQHPAETLTISIELLQDCEGCKDEPVQLNRIGKGTIEAQWQDGAIPQTRQYESGRTAEVLKDFPGSPADWAENSHELLAALKDAADTADQSAVRYATNTIQLRGGAGSIGATDGHHLLVQNGYKFPWREDLLIPASKFLECKEANGAETIYIGRTENWVSLRIDAWTIHFNIDKVGRFPRLEEHIRPSDAALAKLCLSEADAAFLAQSLDRLPCHDEMYRPVTLDLNGKVIVRAKSLDPTRVTELSLVGSRTDGTPTVLNTNRRYLARAIRLGFREVLVIDNTKPVQCHDDRRSFVWALLDPQGNIKASDNPIRIESPSQDAIPDSVPQQERKETTMPRRKASDYGVVPSNGTTSAAPSGTINGTANGVGGPPIDSTNGEHANEASLIAQAEGVRASLKESADKVADLISSLKRHRRQSRLVQSTLSSLKQLQTLDA